MEKRMENLTVSVNTEDSLVHIRQEDLCSEEQVVCVSPDQVEVLCQWLKEAREELTSGVMNNGE